MEKNEVKVVLVTAPAGDGALELAKGLLESETAACVNIIPSVRSIYRWEGKVCDDEEALLVIKTIASGVEALRREVISRHPYEVPEFVVLDVRGGHGPYLDWVRDSVRRGV